MKYKKNKNSEDALVLDMSSYEKKSNKEKESKEATDGASLDENVRQKEDFTVKKNDGSKTETLLFESETEGNVQSCHDSEIDDSSGVVTIKESARGGLWNATCEKTKKYAGIALKKTKRYAGLVFIDGMTGMALGLFATLIIGTIVGQVGEYVGDNFVGIILKQIGAAAKMLMGAGIGVGVACKFKKSPLLVVSAGVAGLIGAQATVILEFVRIADAEANFSISGPKEPVGAFIAAMIAISFGGLVSGKTKLDIILTPLLSILTGAVAGLLVGPPISAGMTAIGKTIEWAMEQNRVVMGIAVAVLMGIALTAPISSAALGISLGLSGHVAGAAAVGCCCQMIGFAVASFRENKWGGLVAQGVGTSMLQMPNIMKKPVIWLPAIITSAILGPISSAVLGMTNNDIGSGMGTAGLVGPLMAFKDMVGSGVDAWQAVLEIGLMHFILPAAICLAISELMRKIGWIKKGDMKLTIN